MRPMRRSHDISGANGHHAAHPLTPRHKAVRKRNKRGRMAVKGLLMGAMIFGGGATARPKATPKTKSSSPVAELLSDLPVA